MVSPQEASIPVTQKTELSGTTAKSELVDGKPKQTVLELRTSCPTCGSALQSGLGNEKGADDSAVLPQSGATIALKSGPGYRAVASEEIASSPEKTDQTQTKQPSAKLTRIGRVVEDSEGKTKIVDEAEWEAPLDLVNDGTFAITLKKEIKDYTPWGKPIEGNDEITIISPSLQKLFRSVVRYFPGIGLDGSNITFSDPYRPLFFYFDKLRFACEQSPDLKCKEDFDSLTSFYMNWVIQEHKRIQEVIEQGVIQYNCLWALFCPGDLIYGLDNMSQPCLYVLVAADFREPEHSFRQDDEYSSTKFHRLCADLWCITWDDASKKFQRFSTTRTIRSFSGGRSIVSLPFYPLKYYGNGDQEEIDKLLEVLEKRGRKWKSLVSEPPSCRSYSGSAMEKLTTDYEPLDERVVVDGSAEFGKSRRERYMFGTIGGLGAHRYLDREVPLVSDGMSDEYTNFDNFDPKEEFSALQAQLCLSAVSCYSLRSRKWYNICVSQVKEIHWAKEALEHLVLDESNKKMLLGLVQRHRKNKDEGLSDVIPSKGKGLVIILHGPPGVGKTLTAETIAEYTQKPLYPLNVGEITTTTDVVEHLRKAFDTASRWDAVLLLDEADVLLEKRSYEDIRRNGIVSVFLRMLEYYEGILFLTTNRLATMDVAFQSRIHIALKYNSLRPGVRRQIWQNFIKRLDNREAEGKRELLDHLDDMQEWELNGRQIRNVLAIAESLALSEERRRGALRYSHVEAVANETINFDRFFDDTNREKKGQVAEVNGRQFQEKRLRNFRIDM